MKNLPTWKQLEDIGIVIQEGGKAKKLHKAGERLGGERTASESDTNKLCEALWSKKIIRHLKSFLSTTPAIHPKTGQPILKEDKTPYMMREVEHSLHFKLKKDEHGNYVPWFGKDGNTALDKYGNEILDGEIVEVNSGEEGSVSPEVWVDDMVSIHTHPAVYLDKELEPYMNTEYMRSADKFSMYHRGGNFIVDPHIPSGADILMYLGARGTPPVKAGCLAEITPSKIDPTLENYILRCYNFECLSKGEKSDLISMTRTLMGWEDQMRGVRAKPGIVGRTAKGQIWRGTKEDYITMKVQNIYDLFKSIAMWNDNPLMRFLRNSEKCQCSFRFDDVES